MMQELFGIALHTIALYMFSRTEQIVPDARWGCGGKWNYRLMKVGLVAETSGLLKPIIIHMFGT